MITIDWTTVILAFLTALPPTIMAFAAYRKGLDNEITLDEIQGIEDKGVEKLQDALMRLEQERRRLGTDFAATFKAELAAEFKLAIAAETARSLVELAALRSEIQGLLKKKQDT